MVYDSNDVDVEPKPKKNASEDLLASDVLMTGVKESITQSLTSQIDHEIARYEKEIPIPLKGFCHRLVEEEIISVSHALQTGSENRIENKKIKSSHP